jgi:hypothetical protein
MEPAECSACVVQLFRLIKLDVDRLKLMNQEVMCKIGLILQENMRRTLALEVQRRQQLMMRAAGSADLMPVESVSEQVCNALQIMPGASNSPQILFPGTQQKIKSKGDGTLSVEYIHSPERDPLLHQIRQSAKYAVRVAYWCLRLHASSFSSTSLHQLVRLIVQHRLDGVISWVEISRCLRLANKRALRGPEGVKNAREYTECVELIVDVHASKVRCSCPLVFRAAFIVTYILGTTPVAL